MVCQILLVIHLTSNAFMMIFGLIELYVKDQSLQLMIVLIPRLVKLDVIQPLIVFNFFVREEDRTRM